MSNFQQKLWDIHKGKYNPFRRDEADVRTRLSYYPVSTLLAKRQTHTPGS